MDLCLHRSHDHDKVRCLEPAGHRGPHNYGLDPTMLVVPFEQERVHLPVCPECGRIMKHHPHDSWKCCGVSYDSTEEALCAYGEVRGKRLKITDVTVIVGTRSTDTVYLETELPSPFPPEVSEGQPLILTFEARPTRGVGYVSDILKMKPKVIDARGGSSGNPQGSS